MSPHELLENALKECEAAGAKIVKKSDHWFWKALGKLLWAISFGKMTGFLDRFTTTIGKTIAVPSAWDGLADIQKGEILTHELEHVKQFKKWLYAPYAIAYMLLPLPIGLAWFRYKWEREAYAKGVNAALDAMGENNRPLMRMIFIEHIVTTLSGSSYLWAWPFKGSIRKWAEEAIKKP